jgi:hypothetical protein
VINQADILGYIQTLPDSLKESFNNSLNNASNFNKMSLMVFTRLACEKSLVGYPELDKFALLPEKEKEMAYMKEVLSVVTIDELIDAVYVQTKIQQEKLFTKLQLFLFGSFFNLVGAKLMGLDHNGLKKLRKLDLQAYDKIGDLIICLGLYNYLDVGSVEAINIFG